MYPLNNLIQTGKRLQILLPKRDRRILAACFSLFLLSLVLLEIPSDWLELRVLDFKSKLLSTFVYTAPSSDILLLAIDTETLAQAPHSWPWPNHYWAEVINNLNAKYNPEAVVIDVYFQDKKDAQTDPIATLAESFRGLGRIGLVGVFEEMVLSAGIQLQIFPPAKELRDGAAFWGLAQQRIDRDGKVRTFLLQDQRITRKHLAWELQKFLGRKLPEYPELQRMEQAKGLIALRSPSRGFPRVSLIEVVNHTTDPAILEGKTIVIGSTAPILHDFHETSLGLMAGPDIICNTFQTIRENRLQLYNPNAFLRFKYLLLAIFLALFIRFDFIKKPNLGMIVTLVLMPFALVAWSFVPRVYPPVGMTYIVFFIVSLMIYTLMRLITLSEIRQSLHEAEICGKIQKQFFPEKELEHSSGIKCAGKCVPYQNAGGDYYDFFQLKNGNIFFFLGDVSGHGISASMITTAAKSIVSLRAPNEEVSLQDLLHELNSVLISMTKRKMMITAVTGIIDFTDNKVKMVSAGHLPPIQKTADGYVEINLSGGFPIGIVPRFRVPKCREFPIPEEGFIVIYSDGIIEGVDWNNNQLGFDKFNEIVASIDIGSSCDQVIDRLFNELDQHVEGRPFDDDVTFLVVNFNREKQQEEV